MATVLACAAVLVLTGALGVTDALAANAGLWGPNNVSYQNGVVCDARTVETALVSWTGSGGGTAFGLSPIQAGYGSTDEPATNGVAVPVVPSHNGLDATTVAQLAFLISRHGSDPSAGVVADVAADVLNLTDAENAGVTDCLSSGSGGAAQSVATTLLTEAAHLAGPYSINVTGPSTPTAAGKPVPLIAHVTSAAGYPVPGVAVDFTPAGAGTSVSAVSVPTGTDGTATVDARTAAGQPTNGAMVTASVTAPVGLLETSSGSDVPLVEAAPPRQYSDRFALDVDTQPDPHLQLTNAASLLLTNGQLGQTLTVTGMNGHSGAATVSVYGPLTLTAAGCTVHTAADWAAARAAQKVVEAPQVTLTGDGSYPVDDATQLSPGCYRAVARLQTTDADPEVGATVTGSDVTVAPVIVTAVPAHGGLAPAGGLQTSLRATSRFAASWQDVRGEVLGPRAASPSSGSCPTTGWASTRSAAVVTSIGATSTSESAEQNTAGTADPSSTDPSSTDPSSTDPSSTDPSSTDPSSTDPSGTDLSSSDPGTTNDSGIAAVPVTSGAVSRAGCYAFKLTATLVVPGLGTTTVGVTPGTQSAPLHVITPSVSVSRLSGSGVDTGGHVSATVTVSQSQGQPGSLRLELLRLPYTYRGCFGADWRHAPVVDPRAAAPVRSTDGDNTYQVTSAAVPGTACWTVVPVFTASANPAVQARAIAGSDPMLAFTSTPRAASDVLESATPRTGSNSAREVGVGLGVAVAVLVVVLATALSARRGRRNETIDPRDRLLA